ncbi:MAG: DUF4388 domain-containing protein [Actinomycetota bacterium]
MYKGRLDELSLLDICRLIRNAESDGVLQVRGSATSGSIAFVKGSIPYARSGRVQAGYGRDLVARRALSEEQMKRALHMCALGGEPLEDLLVSSGLVSSTSLEKALRREILNAALDLMRWRTGDFFFKEGERVEGNFPVGMSVDELAEKAELLPVVERYAAAVPTLARPAPAGVGGIRSLWTLDGLEREILAAVDGRRSLDEIAKSRRLGMLTVLEGVADLLTNDLIALRFEDEEVIDLHDTSTSGDRLVGDRVARL